VSGTRRRAPALPVSSLCSDLAPLPRPLTPLSASLSLPTLSRWAEPAASTPKSGASALHTLGIYVNSNFDAGNAEVVNVGSALTRGVTHEVDLRIAPDPFCERDGRSHFQWFYFRVSGAKGEQLR